MHRTKKGAGLAAASAVVFALAAAGGTARAADLVEAQPTATGPSWTGVYLGVHGGIAGGNLDYTLLPVPAAGIPNSTGYHFGDQQGVYGAHLGADYQFAPRFVGGIQVDYTRLDMTFAPFASGGFGKLAKAEDVFTATGRLGFLTSPETLVYGRVGYAGIRVKAEEGFDGTDTQIVDGIIGGVGIETFLFGNLTGRVEAAYVAPLGDLTLEEDAERFEPSTLLLTAGVSYRFGAQGRAHEVTPGPETSFNGFYLGVAGGYATAQTDLAVDVPGASVGPYADETGTANGFVGYDLRFSRFVAGVEAEATYLDLDFKDPTGNSFDPNGTTKFASVNGMFAVGGRVGYVATPSTLIYAKGGYAGFFTKVNDDFFALDGDDDSDLLSGYQVGVGIETAVTEDITLRVEGLYAEALDDLTVTNSQFDQNSVKPRLVSAKAGVAYRF